MDNLKELFDNPIFSGGIMLSLLGAALFSLKSIPMMIWRQVQSKLIHRVIIHDYDDLFAILEQWLYDNHRGSFREVAARSSFESETRQSRITLKREPSVMWLRVNRKLLVFSTVKEKLEHASSSISMFSARYSISGLMARDCIQAFLKDIHEAHHARIRGNQVEVFVSNSWGDWCRMSTLRVKPFSSIVLPNGLRESILSDLQDFRLSKQWYNDRAIPYRRQFILHGEPGTGKTSIALASALEMNADVYILNLKDIASDHALQQAYASIRGNAVLLIDDIDTYFKLRESSNDKVSFGTVLNCMDGALYREGLITFLTTNHIEQMDPAILRAGRTDRVIEVPRPGITEIREYMRGFYKAEVEPMDQVASTIPMSAVQEACLMFKDMPALAIDHLQKQTA